MPEKVNVGIIGLGGRGTWTLRDILCKRQDVNVVAVCDEYRDRADKAGEIALEKKGKKPIVTTDWREVVASKEVDAVVNCTAWESHAVVSVGAMENGKFVAMEVGGAYSIDECFALVEAYKKTGIHCMMAENCCYNREELMALNMVRQGVFGKIVHCEGGYNHDLREEISTGIENRHYRLRNYMHRNADNYPTHELGPISKILNINRGNKMNYLVSVASGAWGLNDFAARNEKINPSFKTFNFKQGDIVKTLIKCEGGETITLTLDTTLPRSYSRGFTVRGTKGMFFEDGNGVFIDGRHSEWTKEFYNNKSEFFEKYEHRLWQSDTAKNYTGGHGGMDWLVYEGFFDYVKNGGNPPIDTYDTAAWMAITPLSEKSIEQGGARVDIPDFTEGKWKDRKDICESYFSLDK